MDEPNFSWGKELPGDILEKWPKNEAGEPVAPAYLTDCLQADMGDTIIMSMLEANGIPCFRIFPHYGGFGNLILGMSAEGVSLFVPETMIDEAKELLTEGEFEYDE